MELAKVEFSTNAMEQGIKQIPKTQKQRQKGKEVITRANFPGTKHPRGPKGTAIRFAQKHLATAIWEKAT